MTASSTGNEQVCPEAALFSPDGEQVGYARSVSGAIGFTKKLPSTGRYTIVASSLQACARMGPYSIMVQRVGFGSTTPVTSTIPPTASPPSTTLKAPLESTPQPSTPEVSPTPEFPVPLLGILGLLVVAGLAIGYGAFRYRARSGTPGEQPMGPGSSVTSPGAPRVPSLKRLTIEHDVFISYASEDKPVADAITALLESQGIRCWVAPRDILPGMKYQEAIIDAIDSSAIIVLVFSSHSNTSPHVISEMTEAMSKEVIIVPFRIEDILPSKAMKYLIGVPHWLDAITPPLEKHIDELAKTVQVILNQKKDSSASED